MVFLGFPTSFPWKKPPAAPPRSQASASHSSSRRQRAPAVAEVGEIKLGGFELMFTLLKLGDFPVR